MDRNPPDEYGPCWISFEGEFSGVSYAIASMFCPWRGVRPQNIPSTTFSKQVVAYWRGRIQYDWTVTW